MEEWRARLAAVADTLRCTRAEAAALAVLLVGTLAGLGVVWWVAQPGPAPTDGSDRAVAGPSPARDDDPDTGSAGGDNGFAGEPEPVLVHVAGEVGDPGVVEVPAGSRVADAIDAAGGAGEAADLSRVNLARVVKDGERIVVGHVDDAGEAGGAGAVGPDGKVDVNRADAATLQEVPGIGPVTAERILSHREEHGPFTSEQQLLDVPGIGERTLDRLVDHLRW